MDLKDFNTGAEEFTLNDLSAINSFTPVKSVLSNGNMAAMATSLGGPDNAVDNFRTISAELDANGKSFTADQIVENNSNQVMADSKQGVIDILSDPSVSFEEKQSVAKAFTSNILGPKSLTNMVAERAIASDSGNETNEAETSRVNLTAVLDKVDNYNRTVQSIINQEAVKSSPDKLKMFADLAETIVPFSQQATIGKILDEVRGGDKGAYVKSVALLGSSKAEIRDRIKSMPIEDRQKFLSTLMSYVNSSDTLIMPDKNDLMHMDYLRTILDDGYYSDTEKWVDNASSIVDLLFLGLGPISKGKAALKGMLTASEELQAGHRALGSAGEIARQSAEHRQLGSAGGLAAQLNYKEFGSAGSLASDASRYSVRTDVQPASLSQVFKDTNPEKARIAHDAAASDTTGEVAKNLYGTSPEEAIANDILPEPPSLDGGVRNKISSPDEKSVMRNTPNENIMDFINDDGANYYFKEEKIKANARVVNDFKNAVGVYSRTEMFHSEMVPNGTIVHAVYGPKDFGYLDGQSGIDLVKLALKDYGIDENNITLLYREGAKYEPIDLYTANKLRPKGGDFLVQVDYKYTISPHDVIANIDGGVRNNLFDYVPFPGNRSFGSLQRHLIDPQSMFSPTLTRGANAVHDKMAGLESVLVDSGKKFAKAYAGLKSDRKQIVERFIKEANSKGIATNYNTMKAAGLSDNEMKIISDWREHWDNVYWLENRDLAKSLSNRGYKVYEDRVNDTKVFMKPLSRNEAKHGIEVFDSNTGKILNMTRQEIDALYDAGGEIGKLRSFIDNNGKQIENIVSHNVPGKGYTRAINEWDKILNYREGYYQVHYNQPRFIVKRVKDADGRLLYEKAIATAGDRSSADLMIKRMEATDGGEYYQRSDVKKLNVDSNEYWDLQTAIGRTAQRVRGERLEDATSKMLATDQENILDPVQAMTRSIRSIATRTSTRDFLESMKTRFMRNYSDIISEKDRFGQITYPTSVSGIGRKGVDTGSRGADARSMWEWINSLENGYVDAIDEAYKVVINSIAEQLGSKGFIYGEKAATKVGEMAGPSAAGKSLAYKAFLATNPLRQALVQGHQALQLSAIFPEFMGTGKFISQTMALSLRMRDVPVSDIMLKAAGWTRKDFEEIVKYYKKSGMNAAVDANNLVRGDLRDLANTTIMQRVGSAAGYPIRFMQKIGFDTGEQFTNMTAWLAFRDRAAKTGAKLDAEVYDNIAGEARNFTYNMTRPGDFPYTQNSLRVMFQFLQAPHKAMLQMATNRILTKGEKARLAVFNAVMYGVPTGLATTFFGDLLPDDKTTRDLITNGLEQTILNKTLSLTTGDNVDIDFSGLAPSDVHGMMSTLTNMLSTNIYEVIGNSPSGQLLFGNNPRVTNFFKTAARYFGLIDDIGDPKEFSDVAHSFASISSGYSNAFKAIYAFKYGKKINSVGSVTDENVNTPEAIAQVFGFPTMTEAARWKTSQEMYEQSQSFQSDVNNWYKDFKTNIKSSENDPKQLQYQAKLFGEAWRVWGNSQKARQIILNNIRKDVLAGDNTLMQSILNASDWMDIGKLKDIARTANMDENKKQQLLEALDFMDGYKGE